MSVRAVAVVLVIGVGILAFLGISKYHGPPPDAATPAEAPPVDGTPSPHANMEAPDVDSADPGITWSPAARWQKQPDRAMRLATYRIPRAGGDSEDAECALFYFGPGQGGGVDENIERWIGEFGHASPARRSSAEVAGMDVARVEVSGTYLAHGGSQNDAQNPRSDWKLLGAIIDCPGGRVFCRLSGPTQTVDRARKEFDGMIAGMKKK